MIFSCSLIYFCIVIVLLENLRVFLGTDKKKIIERLKYEVLALLTAQEDDVATTLLMLPFAFQDFEVMRLTYYSYFYNYLLQRIYLIPHYNYIDNWYCYCSHKKHSRHVKRVYRIRIMSSYMMRYDIILKDFFNVKCFVV